MLLPSEQRFWISALSAAVCFLSAASAGLRYNYGDGSFYVGQVDEKGRPDGVGKYFNTTGALGKYKHMCKGDPRPRLLIEGLKIAFKGSIFVMST